MIDKGARWHPLCPGRVQFHYPVRENCVCLVISHQTYPDSPRELQAQVSATQRIDQVRKRPNDRPMCRGVYVCVCV